jgi:hypothetical protein
LRIGCGVIQGDGPVPLAGVGGGVPVSSAPLQEAREFGRGLGGALFGEEVAAVERSPLHRVRLLLPDREHVVGGADPLCAPEHEHGAVDPLLAGAVVREIDRCAGAVVLAAGVDGRCVEAAPVLGDGGLVERAGCAAPLSQCPVEVEAGVGADQPLGQVGRLDEKEVAPDCGRALLVEQSVDRLGRNDVEDREPGDRLGMIKCQCRATRAPRSCPTTAKRSKPKARMSSSWSRAIARFEYGSWLSSERGLRLSP